MRNRFICWISRPPSGSFGSVEWIRSVGYLHGFIFQSQNVPKKQRWWGGRMSSLGIENNPGVRRTGRDTPSPGRLRKSKSSGIPMCSNSECLSQTENAPKHARPRLFRTAQTLTEHAGADRAQTAVWESSLFTVTHLTSCPSVRCVSVRK